MLVNLKPSQEDFNGRKALLLVYLGFFCVVAIINLPRQIYSMCKCQYMCAMMLIYFKSTVSILEFSKPLNFKYMERKSLGGLSILKATVA